MNYFEFYEIPVSFQVDEAALRRVFYQNSKKFHPDFHTLSDEYQQAEMLEKASLNNEAYQTLSDPDRRIHYVLQIKGMLDEEGKQNIPREFLMEVMDINENLMELELEFDEARFASTVRDVENLENQLAGAIRPVLENYADDNQHRPDLQAVLDYYLKKRYLLRIRENLSKFAAH